MKTSRKTRESFSRGALAMEIEHAERLVAAAEREARDVRLQVKRAERRESRVRSKPPAATVRGRESAAERLKAVRANRLRAERHHRAVAKSLAAKLKRLATLRRQARRLDQALDRFHADFPVPPTTEQVLVGTQIRAARAMLDLSQRDLACRTGTSVSTLRDLEKGGSLSAANPLVIRRLCKVLSDAGVDFVSDGLYVGIGGPGVRLRKEAARSRSRTESPPQEKTGVKRRRAVA